MAKLFILESFNWVTRATISRYSSLTIGLCIKCKEAVLVADLANNIFLRSFNNCSILLKDNLNVAIKQLRARDKVGLEGGTIKHIRENKSVRLVFNSNLE